MMLMAGKGEPKRISDSEDGHDEPILSAARECESNFSTSLKYMESNQASYKDILGTLQTKFLDWAAYLGVFAERGASLDHRLKRHQQYRDLVLLLLDTLNSCLIQTQSSEAESDESSDDEIDRSKVELTGIQNSIKELDRLAIHIRQSSITSLEARVKAFGARKLADVAPFEALATNVVEGLYADAPVILVERLSKAMTQRYTRLLYWRSHDKKLRLDRRRWEKSPDSGVKEDLKSTNTPHVSATESQQLQQQLDRSSASDHANSEPVSKGTGLTRISETIPSNTGSHLALPPAEGQMDRTGRGTGTTVLNSGAKFPPAPKLKPGEEQAPCIYCRRKITMDTLDDVVLWKKHINNDLLPFVCLSNTCPDAPAFGSRSEWRSHMERDHSSFWSWCGSTRNHSKPSHAESIDPAESGTNQSPNQYECPLCSFDLQEHRPGPVRSRLQGPKSAAAEQSNSQNVKLPFDQTELGLIEPPRSSNAKKSVRFNATIKDPKPADESPASTTSSKASEIVSRKATNTAMLNHIADHLQFLALLTPRLSTEKFSDGKVQHTSSSRALSSDGFSGRRSTLDDEVEISGMFTFSINQKKTSNEPGADNEAKSEDDQTRALLWAAENGHKTMVRDLLKKGANTETSDPCGRKPVSLAAMNGHELSVKDLLEFGAILDARDEDGQTALSWAAMNGHTAVVKVLVSRGANIEAQDLSGLTPLSWAAMNGHEPVVRFLCDCGADIEAQDQSGRTPLSWAEMDGHETVVECLRKYVARIRAMDRPKRSHAGHGTLMINKTPPTVVHPASIDRKCTKEFVLGNTLHNPTYLRQSAFGEFLHPDRVMATIHSHFSFMSQDKSQWLVKYAIDNPRIFLTLVITKLVRRMPLLHLGNFRDNDLPVRSQYDEGAMMRVYSIKDDQNRPWQCFVEGEDESSSWDFADIKQFVLNQWLFSAIIFEEDRFRYEVHRDCPLPFTTLPQATVPQATATFGHFGKVFRLGLQPDHTSSISTMHFPLVPISSLSPREVAVKQLRIDGAEDEELTQFFHKEASVLETMRRLQHPHLIEAILVYEKGPDRCIVFPWARGGNLRQFWDRTPGPSDQQVTQWAWHQIRGLASGLTSLHGEGTRHGDVKPENILIFCDDDDSQLGQLVISDMGVAKFHAEETGKRNALGYATTNRSGTLRYEPPEIEFYRTGIISRKYDSWSLGCVLFEFIIWLVRGSTAHTRFNQELRAANSRLDRFWDQDSNQVPVLHPVVGRWINEELPAHLVAVAALRDLLDLVGRRLLVPSVKSRAYLQEFQDSLQNIEEKCLSDPSYLWDESAKASASSREPASEVVDNLLVDGSEI